MGRRKVKIEAIQAGKRRSQTLRQRRKGLLKKAMELSIMCNVEVSLVVYSPWNNEYVEYSSSPDVFSGIPPQKDRPSVATNADYSRLFPEDSEPKSADELHTTTKSPKTVTRTPTKTSPKEKPKSSKRASKRRREPDDDDDSYEEDNELKDSLGEHGFVYTPSQSTQFNGMSALQAYNASKADSSTTTTTTTNTSTSTNTATSTNTVTNTNTSTNVVQKKTLSFAAAPKASKCSGGAPLKRPKIEVKAPQQSNSVVLPPSYPTPMPGNTPMGFMYNKSTEMPSNGNISPIFSNVTFSTPSLSMPMIWTPPRSSSIGGGGHPLATSTEMSAFSTEISKTKK